MSELEKARAEIEEADREIARLFEKRMKAAEIIADYKCKNNLPVRDLKREAEMSEKYKGYRLQPYYDELLRDIIDLSCRRQEELIPVEGVTKLTVNHNKGYYNIYYGSNIISKAAEFFDLDRKVMIVTDSGVPEKYVKSVAAQCKECFVFSFPQGEKSKNINTVCDILSFLLKNNFTRSDCVVSVGGGISGDMSGLASAMYMRGIDFYNIPTTLLSQVDSSVGGKTGVDFGNIKNSVGAFYQPKGVLIDTDTLKTLDERQFASGMAEIIKAGFIADKEILNLLENNGNIEEIILRALKVKINVVEKDPEEKNLRRMLNFGHTVGHAIESAENGELLHGECVAAGMIPMCGDDVRVRLVSLLKKYGLPTEYDGDKKSLLRYLQNDKKNSGSDLRTVFVNEEGSFEFRNITADEIIKRAEKYI